MKIIFLAGTRPEAIKLAPLVHYFRKHAQNIKTVLCSSGQHKEMISQAFQDFELTPDRDLAVMQPGQTLAALSANLFRAVDKMLEQEKPTWVVVQGDTTTAMIASVCSFYKRIKVAHVEAGLRSFNRFQPFPEEINRRIVGLVVDKHFSPTPEAKNNLLREGVPPDAITVTGNTVIDALLWMVEKVRQEPPSLPSGAEEVVMSGQPFVLITCHRRESFGEGLLNICLAIRELARLFPEVAFIYPVHLNPRVQQPVLDILGSTPGVLLILPQAYRPFVRLMDSCTLLLTDSGGIQEEGPSLGKPVLVMREVTERPEGVAAGTSKLVGSETDDIVREVSTLLTDHNSYKKMAQTRNPYGDGRACERIWRTLNRA